MTEYAYLVVQIILRSHSHLPGLELSKINKYNNVYMYPKEVHTSKMSDSSLHPEKPVGFLITKSSSSPVTVLNA